MSKLADRLPMLRGNDVRLPMTRDVVGSVIEDGRVDKKNLVDKIVEELENERVDLSVIEQEARHAIAEQFVMAWSARSVIRFDRAQRMPVYQMDFGFAGSFFKVGGVFVLPEAMTVEDFDVMLERYDRRIENTQVDRDIVAQLRESARPGLEAGQNLVEQFEAGTLVLQSVTDTPEVEPGSENGDEVQDEDEGEA